jgi:hypothetical protein
MSTSIRAWGERRAVSALRSSFPATTSTGCRTGCTSWRPSPAPTATSGTTSGWLRRRAGSPSHRSSCAIRRARSASSASSVAAGRSRRTPSRGSRRWWERASIANADDTKNESFRHPARGAPAPSPGSTGGASRRPRERVLTRHRQADPANATRCASHPRGIVSRSDLIAGGPRRNGSDSGRPTGSCPGATTPTAVRSATRANRRSTCRTAAALTAWLLEDLPVGSESTRMSCLDGTGM